jgi:hypothetical protein
MKNYYLVLTILFGVTTIFQSCKKNKSSTVECFPNEITTRQITNKQATIQLTNGQFYIVEQGTIDTKLNPCNLTQEFQVNNLQVTISGDIKETTQGVSGPCCTDNFVISKITK